MFTTSSVIIVFFVKNKMYMMYLSLLLVKYELCLKNTKKTPQSITWAENKIQPKYWFSQLKIVAYIERWIVVRMILYLVVRFIQIHPTPIVNFMSQNWHLVIPLNFSPNWKVKVVFLNIPFQSHK